MDRKNRYEQRRLIHIHTYIYTYVFLHMNTSVYIHIYIYPIHITYVYIYINLFIRMSACMYACIFKHVNTCICMNTELQNVRWRVMTNFFRGVRRQNFWICRRTGSNPRMNTVVSSGPGNMEGHYRQVFESQRDSMRFMLRLRERADARQLVAIHHARLKD